MDQIYSSILKLVCNIFFSINWNIPYKFYQIWLKHYLDIVQHMVKWLDIHTYWSKDRQWYTNIKSLNQVCLSLYWIYYVDLTCSNFFTCILQERVKLSDKKGNILTNKSYNKNKYLTRSFSCFPACWQPCSATNIRRISFVPWKKEYNVEYLHRLLFNIQSLVRFYSVKFYQYLYWCFRGIALISYYTIIAKLK